MDGRMTGLLAVAVLFGSIPTASAQTVKTPSVGHTRGPTEIGVGLSGYALDGGGRRLLLDTDDVHEPAVNLRVTLPLTDRFAIEGLMTVGHRDAWYGNTVEGLYGVQIKQRIVRASGPAFQSFFTYGLGGYYRVAPDPSAKGFDFTRADQLLRERGHLACGSPCGGSTTTAPFIILAGGGVQQTFSRHFALRAELQTMVASPPYSPYPFPLGVRASTSVSIPFGHYEGRR